MKRSVSAIFVLRPQRCCILMNKKFPRKDVFDQGSLPLGLLECGRVQGCGR